MTQSRRAQRNTPQLAWRKRTSGRTLAQRRADFEAQARRYLAENEHMALADLSQVKSRLKGLHKELERREGGRVTQYEIAEALGVPHRTFQSWEGGQVETEGKNYDKIAAFYSERLDRPITRNWILFGQDDEPGPVETMPASANPSLDAVAEAVEELKLEMSAMKTELLAEIAKVQVAQGAQQPKPGSAEQH